MLKTLDTIGCQRPVFSLGVSQRMHKITNLCKFELNWSSKLQENNERKKTPVSHKLCAYRCTKLLGHDKPRVVGLESIERCRGKI